MLLFIRGKCAGQWVQIKRYILFQREKGCGLPECIYHILSRIKALHYCFELSFQCKLCGCCSTSQHPAGRKLSVCWPLWKYLGTKRQTRMLKHNCIGIVQLRIDGVYNRDASLRHCRKMLPLPTKSTSHFRYHLNSNVHSYSKSMQPRHGQKHFWHALDPLLTTMSGRWNRRTYS